MARCDVCGNEYARSFTVEREGQRWTFDSIECAAHRIAPRCNHCGCPVLGHGVEAGGAVYCCAHCARESGVTGAADHAR
jgi:hypothetical protein